MRDHTFKSQFDVACGHHSFDVSADVDFLEYCTKGCDGNIGICLTITCRECGTVVHEYIVNSHEH